MPIIAPETWFFLGGVLPDFGWARTFFKRLAELAAFSLRPGRSALAR